MKTKLNPLPSLLMIVVIAAAAWQVVMAQDKAAPPVNEPPTLFMIVSQGGTNPPVATIVTNTLLGNPNPVFTRIAPGLYHLTLVGGVVNGATYYAATPRMRIAEIGVFAMARTSTNVIVINSYRMIPANAPNTPTIQIGDGIFQDTPFIIQQWD